MKNDKDMTQPFIPALKSGGRLIRMTALLGATTLAAGCATVNNPNPNDPWESYNRGMYTFNDTVDRAVLKPIATGYDAIMPDPVQTCIGNVFNNFADVWSAANSFLQGRGHDFVNTVGRVLFNSTMGLGGCIDVASMNGAKRIQNDFGVTLGVWGLESGPYLVLPFLGSSSVRDGAGTVGTFAANVSPVTPVLAMDNVAARNAIIALYAIETRAGLLDADKLVNEIALDRYSFIRDAYMQRRKAQVDSRRANPALPDYSENNLPDYSDDDAPDATPAVSPSTAPAAKPAQ